MARHEMVVDRTGSFAGGTGVKLGFNYDAEICNVYANARDSTGATAVVATETGSLVLDSGKGLTWDTVITTNAFSSAGNWGYVPASKVVISSGDDVALGVSGSAPAYWHYTVKAEYIR